MNGYRMKPVTDEDILNDIIERLAKGVLPWRRPEGKRGGRGVPPAAAEGASCAIYALAGPGCE